MEYPQSSTSGLTVRLSPKLEHERPKNSYFFIIIYLNALPKVWSSASNSNDAAVSLAPGSYVERLASCVEELAQVLAH